MAKIGVFDSGVGGISVLKEIIKRFPKEDIIYFGDSLHAPYGDRDIDEIRILSLKVADYLVYNKKVDILVIACNTATGAAKDIMEKRYNIPVIGVIENGIKEAVNLTINKEIAVIATSATVKMGIYRKSILDFNKGMSVIQIEAPLLVGIIENDWKDIPENRMILEYYLNKIPQSTELLILGCTHYPLIREEIEKIYKGKIVDPAVETAKSLNSFLNNMNTGFYGDREDGKLEFYVSGEIERFKKVAEKFLSKEITYIKNVILD